MACVFRGKVPHQLYEAPEYKGSVSQWVNTSIVEIEEREYNNTVPSSHGQQPIPPLQPFFAIAVHFYFPSGLAQFTLVGCVGVMRDPIAQTFTVNIALGSCAFTGME